jgi:hypothetical protein
MGATSYTRTIQMARFGYPAFRAKIPARWCGCKTAKWLLSCEHPRTARWWQLRFRLRGRLIAASPISHPAEAALYNIWKIGADGNGLRQVTAGAGDDTELDVSTDGKRLVFATMRLNIGLSQFDTQVKAGESNIKALTSDPARNEFGPAYSPDGTHLAFFTNLKGVEHESIGMADASGANATQLVRDERTNLFPRWSPDGNRIVYFSFGDQGTDADYRSVGISGGAPQTIIRSGGNFLFDVGRDGRVLYQKDPGKVEAYDSRDGRSLTLGNVPDGAWLFRWSSDGNSVAYCPAAKDVPRRRLEIGNPDAGIRIIFPGRAHVGRTAESF